MYYSAVDGWLNRLCLALVERVIRSFLSSASMLLASCCFRVEVRLLGVVLRDGVLRGLTRLGEMKESGNHVRKAWEGDRHLGEGILGVAAAREDVPEGRGEAERIARRVVMVRMEGLHGLQQPQVGLDVAIPVRQLEQQEVGRGANADLEPGTPADGQQGQQAHRKHQDPDDMRRRKPRRAIRVLVVVAMEEIIQLLVIVLGGHPLGKVLNEAMDQKLHERTPHQPEQDEGDVPNRDGPIHPGEEHDQHDLHGQRHLGTVLVRQLEQAPERYGVFLRGDGGVDRGGRTFGPRIHRGGSHDEKERG